ncbi:MAG: biopolymer transporter ExbD [Pseudomonadota bacterium]
MIEFERQARRAKSIPLVSLIDVVFQLLIYFMLTSSFTRSESLELLLPPAVNAASQAAKNEDAKTIHIYISDLGETFIEQRSVGEQQMVSELKEMLASNPDNGILVLSASKVSVQVMVRVMDRIYTAGGKNVAVADWVMPKAVEKKANG